MRIALFTESYDPIINGVSTSVKTLAEELGHAGHAPEIVAPRFPGHTDRGPLAIRRMPSWTSIYNPQNPFAYAPPLFGVASSLKDCFPDVVHTQQPFGMGLQGRRLAKVRGVPLVSTFHTLYQDYTHYANFLPQPIILWFLIRHLRFYYGRDCHKIIVPSRAAGQSLVKIGIDEQKLVVVPTGIPDPRPVLPSEIEAVHNKLQVSSKTPLLLYVGRLAKEKNIEALFSVLAEVSDDTVLALVGGGPQTEALKLDVQQRGLAARVRFVGPVPRAELAPIYAAATVFVFPSVTETQGMVLCEAQSYGLPCVVADGGGAPEFVRDGIDGLIVPPEALGAATASLLTDTEKRRAFGRAATESPLRLTPSEMARRLVDVYRS